MMHHYKACGLRNVYLVNGYKIHAKNGNAVSFEDFEGLQKALGRFIIERPCRLEGDEIRFLRDEMELSQQSLASIINKTDQTIANWEKGKTLISIEADLFIRQLYLASIGDNVEFKWLLDRLKEVDRCEVELRMEFTQERWKARTEIIA